MPDKDTIFHLRDILSKSAFKHAAFPFVVCGEDSCVVDKSPATGLTFANRLRKSSYVGDSTKLSSVTRIHDDDIVPSVFSIKNGEDIFALDYSTSVDGIGCLILAMPLLNAPYYETATYEDKLDWILNHVKSLIKSSLSALLGSTEVLGTMLNTNDALRDARHALSVYGQMKQYCDSISNTILPTEFPIVLNLFLSEFNSQLNEYKSSVKINLPESIRSANVKINKDGFFSLLSALILTLYVMSDDRIITVDINTRPKALDMSFSTAFIGSSDAEGDNLLPDYSCNSLDSLSTELVRIGHPLAIDILLASAYLDSDELTAAFSLKNRIAKFSLTVPIRDALNNLDITMKSDHSVDSPDTLQNIIERSDKPTADQSGSPSDIGPLC